MPSILNIIPEEITIDIYKKYFKSCLDQLPEASKQKYEIIYNNYKCQCGEYSYPEKYTQKCRKCNDIMCPHCFWKTYKTAWKYSENDFKELCLICTAVKLTT